MRKIPILIIHPERFVRDALSLYLCRRGKLHVVGCLPRAGELDRATHGRRCPPKVVLFHIDPQARSVLGQLARLGQMYPDAKFLITGQCRPRGAASALEKIARTGKGVYLGGDVSLQDIRRQIQALSRRRAIEAPGPSEGAASSRIGGAAGPTRHETPTQASLTARQLGVFTLMAKGLRNKDIARELNLGTQTVKNHVHAILTKLRVRRREQVRQDAIQSRLHPPQGSSSSRPHQKRY